MLDSKRRYYEPEPQYDVVWHGAVQSEWGKGLLLAPREQTEDERYAMMLSPVGQKAGDLTVAELERGVERLNASLQNPIDFARTSVFNGGGGR